MLFALITLAAAAAAAAAVNVPNYHGCLTALAKRQPYCDTSLSLDERLDSMFTNLTLAEQVGMISPQPSLGSDTCGDHTGGSAGIGLGDYFWLVEANTNVAAFFPQVGGHIYDIIIMNLFKLLRVFELR